MNGLTHSKPDPSKVPGFWDIPHAPMLLPGERHDVFVNNKILISDGVLHDDTCDSLADMFLNSGISAPVSVNGLITDDTYGKGSVRATGWSEQIADMLAGLIVPQLAVMHCDDGTATDWWQEGMHRTWQPVAISPMLRFMADSQHFAHYDAAYMYPDGIHRTLKSVVIYLTDNPSCATRFVSDGQGRLPVWERNHEDWSRPVRNEEILLLSHSKKGRVLIFDHRLCHDVQKYDGAYGDRIIIRTDVIYKKI